MNSMDPQTPASVLSCLHVDTGVFQSTTVMRCPDPVGSRQLELEIPCSVPGQGQGCTCLSFVHLLWQREVPVCRGPLPQGPYQGVLLSGLDSSLLALTEGSLYK